MPLKKQSRHQRRLRAVDASQRAPRLNIRQPRNTRPVQRKVRTGRKAASNTTGPMTA